MKYALLIYPEPGSHEALSEDESRSVSREYFAVRDEDGVIDGGHLQPVHPAEAAEVHAVEADAGSLAAARTLEGMAWLNITRAIASGTWQDAWVLVGPVA